MPPSNDCPECGTPGISATPLGGQDATFYCGTCDTALTTNDWHPDS